MNVAFLTRLSRIAAEPASDAARAAGATALVDAYRHSLYGRLGIGGSCRPTTRAKEEAKDALDDLRLKVLRAELDAPAGAARIYRVARQRIEMTRRALALCIADNRGAVPPQTSGCDDAAPRDDARIIADMRRRLRDRNAFLTSQEAIRQSRDLLARCAASPHRAAIAAPICGWLIGDP
jgi:hypothetical protein